MAVKVAHLKVLKSLESRLWNLDASYQGKLKKCFFLSFSPEQQTTPTHPPQRLRTPKVKIENSQKIIIFPMKNKNFLNGQICHKSI